ncbi:EVI5-like protein [Selaginella moellendorffii]|nr:EVI5-like protein [Selaginella moellendorffii]|eukprot:XP_002968609.2 EVI5-like protein [Selaginella moellendorffii]
MRKAMSRARKKGSAPLELSRDMYGFILRPQHLQRYREFTSIYKEEEAERSERWEHFLRTYGDAADFSATKGAEKDASSDSEVNAKPDGENRVVQRWGELRPSLNIVEQGIATNAGRQQHATKPLENGDVLKTRKTDSGASDIDDSDDEFYDVDKSDAVADSLVSSDQSDSESAIHGKESPWREELQFLVRGGVPMALRGELWQVFVRTKTRRVEGHYERLLEKPSSNGNGNANGYTHHDEPPSVPAQEKYVNQIEKDLPRTFPGHPALDEDGRNALRRLLTAYARHNPDVGYCQAMNFFAGLLLLLMPEENAFWTLTGIIDEYFQGYYSEKLLEAQVDQLVFEELAREQFPRLISHFESLGVQISWMSGPWFLSIFVNVLPWESVLRVWDVLLFEGNRTMLFRTALALLELHAPALLASRDAGDCISVMQTVTGATFDSSQLVLTACMGFQKIERLEALRTKYRPIVLATLDERAAELRLWRSSQGALVKKLSRKLSSLNTSTKEITTAEIIAESGDIEEIDEEDEEIDEKDPADLEEQVAWLKNELCLALEEKKRATARAEELDVALMEIVKDDNRRELSAKVESLEAELSTVKQMLSDKQEQEKAMVQVMLRIEQEQKLTEDARCFAEQDAAAQRHAATVMQEKYEQLMDKFAALEKRAVMAETMLEATLQYEAGQTGNLRRQKEEEPSKWSWPLSSPRSTEAATPKPKPSSPVESGKSTDSQEEPARKPGLFSRISWSKLPKNQASPEPSGDRAREEKPAEEEATLSKPCEEEDTATSAGAEDKAGEVSDNVKA